MEFLLLPANSGNSLIPIQRTPYVCQQRYDGSPFLSYPRRVGKAEAGAALSDLMNYRRSERVNPTPIREQESFVQTWLYFGFIAEFLCANSKEGTPNSLKPEGSQEIIDQLYGMLVVQEGETSYVSLDDNKLNELLAIARSRLPESREALIEHYEHLLNCIAHAHPIFSSLPRDFNHTVKYATAALFELVAQAIRSVMSLLGIPRVFGRDWADGYLNEESKKSMMHHGWCPSDIARAEAKFLSIQAMHVIRMLDKSLPKRDHSQCTDVACNIYQIDMNNYNSAHEEPGCLCKDLVIQPQRLDEILQKEDRVPLLCVTGHIHDLKVKLVESGIDTPYVAISHVWADGLGNPHANSLPRCRLAHLRDLVSAINEQNGSSTEPPLIWLDTLCCPAKDGEGKQKAIEKIRLVYHQAKHVLVLDSGLMAYESKAQGSHEKIVRIFTSGWVRRLWTLQEGALARSLYFQFADEAVSLSGLRKDFGEHANSVRHQILALDSMQEVWRIEGFFKRDQHSIEGDQPSLIVLDQALQFRSVTVASDEPLCIGTLMSLDLSAILAVEPKEERMQKVWELLAAEKGGIPALVIFFEEQRIDARGWRWAPQSLLSVTKSIYQANVRIVRWGEGQLGIPTSLGLKVRFPGFRISVLKYEDGKPRNPWPGLKRIPEAYMHFRDKDTGEWYMVSDKRQAYLNSKWTTDEERLEYNKLELFLLHDIADSDKAMIVMRGEGKLLGVNDALYAFPVSDGMKDDKQTQVSGIAVKTERHIIVNLLDPENGYIYTTIGRLAMELRRHEMTDRHLALFERLKDEVGNSSTVLKERMQENEEFKASIKNLRKKMKAMTASVADVDERFVQAVKNFFGPSLVGDVWVLIQDWFNHGYLGEKVDDEQSWYID
ncbi:hypothetical protein D0Z07_1659 [Hyphodiscus hymeniophilus]|uniref:Heterokaryon incompatibility domain-containing protein n=1 Tax=Hyphodiscus hymeniophilus TaxID=353542 RepID=A0A9P6VN23_9HELO|nr:hypothetical protein D0Z07_1659 [Hyphodiscus hymeniophilus]